MIFKYSLYLSLIAAVNGELYGVSGNRLNGGLVAYHSAALDLKGAHTLLSPESAFHSLFKSALAQRIIQCIAAALKLIVFLGGYRSHRADKVRDNISRFYHSHGLLHDVHAVKVIGKLFEPYHRLHRNVLRKGVAVGN